MRVYDSEQLINLVSETKFVHILGAGLNSENLLIRLLRTYLRGDGILFQYTLRMPVLAFLDIQLDL